VDAALSCKDEEFVGEVLALVETILAFRARHYQSVAKKLPEVAKDKAPGTGIQTGSGHFLRSRIATVRRAKDELERKLGDQDSQWSARRIAR
jgi:hypothetical protein